MTMVAGKVVVENGRLLTVDEEAIKAEARELMVEYRKKWKRPGKPRAGWNPTTGRCTAAAPPRIGHEPLGGWIAVINDVRSGSGIAWFAPPQGSRRTDEGFFLHDNPSSKKITRFATRGRTPFRASRDDGHSLFRPGPA